ncbi:MAG: AraC family transcriptional regulator [Bacteroidota bacterium]
MSISTLQKYQFKNPLASSTPVVFEVESFRVTKDCTAHHSHRSEQYKIIFIEDGSGSYQIDFQEFKIESSGIFCLSPGQVLTVESESTKAAYQISFNREFYCVETHGKEIACNGVLFNNIHRATCLQLSAADSAYFKQLVENMIRELENPGKAHQDMLETYLRMFLIEALRKHDEQAAAIPVEGEESNRLVGDFIALVDKHFRKKKAVSEYADLLFVSPKSLAKRLNAQGYPTPTEVIRNRIVLEAKRDLRFTQKSVKEIAFDLGFDDPGYFTRLFKKAGNDSPAAYRLAYLGQEH